MSGGLLSLKWNNHQSTFLHVLSSLCLNDTLSDVTLACEGEFYAAHKLVLATCSEYFEKIFEKIEGKHSVIVLKDVKAEELEALLNYMYEGEVNVMQEKLSGLIKAAEYLKVKGLSDSDEAPELFSRRIFKRSKRRVNPASSSRDISLSPAAKRKRKDTDSSNPSPSNDVERDVLGSNLSASEGRESPRSISNNNQVIDVDQVKDEPDVDLKNEAFSFTESTSFTDQDDYASQETDLPVPSISSQPDTEKEPNISSVMDDGSSTSSHLWEAGDSSNLGSSNRSGDLSHPVSHSYPFSFGANTLQALTGISSPKKYICHLCSYSTIFKSHLEIHTRRHTGEKPFSCHICSYSSSTKSNMTRHIKTFHQMV